MTVLEDIDRQLTACYEAFTDAVLHDDTTTADAMSEAMDELLDQRSHTRHEA